MNERSVLSVSGLRKTFGGVVAVDDLSMSVDLGDIHGIIGPNGSGKTTFFNTVTGVYSPDNGAITFDGTDITGWRPHQIAREGMARTFQIASPFEELSVRKNLTVVHTPDRVSDPETRADEMLETLEIDHVAENLASEVSGGQRKLLELARALMLDPEIALLDEPTAGVNPALADRIVEFLQKINREGTTFIVIEHDMGVMREMADVVTVFNQGRVVTEGTFDSVRQDERVREAYLGQTETDIESVIGRQDCATSSEQVDDADEESKVKNTALGAERADTVYGEAAADAGSVTDKGTDSTSGSRARIVASDIVAGYGQHEVLHGVSIESRGDVTCIFGPNGSGKSTLLKTINGTLTPWEGQVAYEGEDITPLDPAQTIRRGLATVSQGGGIFGSLTVEENLKFGAYSVDDKSVVDGRIDDVLKTFPDLKGKLSVKAGTLSGGQQMMVALGQVMMSGADTLLLDEPSAGLAPALADDAFSMIERFAKREKQVLLVEQNVQSALRIADYVYILAQGEIQFAGSPTTLADEQELMDIYLGVSEA